jgi:hypothetical protein
MRGVAARLLCQYAGLTQREAADVLKMGSGAPVSHQLRMLCAQLPDRVLRGRLAHADTRLKELRHGSEFWFKD